jgi:hypothetical protein
MKTALEPSSRKFALQDAEYAFPNHHLDHPEFEPVVIAEHAGLVFDAQNVMRGLDFAGEIL